MNNAFNWSDAIVLGILVTVLLIGLSWIGVLFVVNRKAKNPKDTFEPHAGKTLGL